MIPQSTTLMTLSDASMALGMKRQIVYKLAESGKIKAEKLGTLVVVQRASVEAYKERNQNAGH